MQTTIMRHSDAGRIVWKSILFWILSGVSALAGSSLVLSGNGTYTISDPNRTSTLDLRVEFQMHSFATPASNSVILALNGAGMDVTYTTSNTLWVTPKRDTISGGTPCILNLADRSNIVVRVQRNYAAMKWYCEMWNVDGTGYYYTDRTISSADSWPHGDGFVGKSSAGHSFGFVRVDSALVAVNSLQPVTAATGNITELKFDGNGNDASGKGHNLGGGDWSFEPTPGQTVYARGGTPNTPTWASFVPLRAGHPSPIISNSYSMADASASVTCYWIQLEGPSSVIFDDRTSCAPTLTGTVFGAYKFRLMVVDNGGTRAETDFDVGAVAYDDNGVVIYPDERLYALLGPEMVRGANSWKYADERQTALALERASLWKPNGGPQLIRPLETDLNGVPLLGTVYWSDTSLSKTIYGIGTNFLDVFCGGAAGPANNAYFIPRKSTPSFGENENGLPRGLYHLVKSCTSDTQISVQTYYESESGLTVASPGVPWGVDNIGGQFPSLRSGTVYIANGSATLYGAGTSFKSLWCNGGTTPIPGAGVMLPQSPLMTGYGISACVSDTEVTLSSPFTGATISAPGGAWIPTKPEPERGTFSINANMNSVYYDTPLAFYREWYRSGDIVALRAARFLAEGMYQTPQYAQWANRSEAVVSGILAATVDSAAMTYNMWPALTARIRGSYAWYVAPDYPGDQREGAYGVWEMALVAKYHPDSNTRAEFRGYLVDHYNKQATKYKLPGHGYFSWYPANVDSGRVWQVTNGSDEATVSSGPNIDSTYCGTPLVSGGIAAATNLSKNLTGSGTSWSGSAGRYIILVGTKGGAVYMEANRIASAPSNTSITLYWPWQGDTGVLTKAHIHDAGFPVKAFERVESNGSSRTPRQYETNDWYSCDVLSSTKIKLDHAFSGDTSGGNVYRKISASNQYETFFPAVYQPFMDGLRASAYATASEALDGYNQTESDGYKSLVKDLIDSMYNNRDSLSNGQVYFSYFPPCKGNPNQPDICNQTITTCGEKRDYNLESANAFAWHYLKTLNATERIRADQFYQWMYAPTGYDAPFASDGCYASYPTTAMGGARDKALGQSFGLGGGSAWPAARIGGVSPPLTTEVQVGFLLSSVQNAASARIRVTSPAGDVSMTNCGSQSPCHLVLDKRFGSYWMELEYLSSSGAVVAASEPQLIQIP